MSLPDLESLLGLQVPYTLKLPQLRRPESIALEADTANHASVRKQLVDQRKADPDWKNPTKQRRRFIRDLMSKGKTEQLANSENWEFSKSEIGKAIDSFFHQDEWGAIGDVVAFLQLSGETAENLWLHSQDKELEAALERGKTHLLPKSRCQWLKFSVQRKAIPMITLLCYHHMAQNDIDDALAVALNNTEYAVAEELLRFGASFPISASIIPAIRSDPPDLEYLKLWVTSPKTPDHAITIQAMQLTARSSPDQQIDSDILDLLLSNWKISPSEAYSLLSFAIEAENLLSIVRISRAVNHSWGAAFSQDSGKAVVSSIVSIKDASLRRVILEFLMVAGVKANVKMLRAELLKDVKENRVNLIELLIRSGVSPHEPHANSVDYAVKQSKVDILALLLSSSIPTDRASRAVDKIPDTASEASQVSLVMLLLKGGATGKPLDKLLVRAVRNTHIVLAETLLKNQASIDYDDAAAVRLAIENNQLDLLDMLLDGTSATPAILSKAIPIAMAVNGNLERRRAMIALVQKGARGVELNMALQSSVYDIEPREDGQLIDLLIDHASPDYQDAKGNSIAIAIARCQVDLVKKLSSKARLEVTFSKGIPVALAALTSSNYEKVVDMMRVLIEKGAKGPLVEKALLEAIPIDTKLQIVKTLSRNGLSSETIASAIHSAAQMEDLGALKLFCDTKGEFQIPKDALEEEIRTLLYGRSYDTSKALILLEYGRRYSEILSPMLAHKGLERHSARVEVAALLVLCGASVDFDDGAVLKLSCKLGDVDMTRVLLRGGPNQVSLTNALTTSAREGPQNTKYDIMTMILKSKAAESGKNEALVIITQQLTLQQQDTKLVKLLLRHNASANYAKGQAISFAIEKLSIPILKELFRQKIDTANLIAPFQCAQRVECTDQIRYSLFQELLKAGYKPGSSQALEEALIESLKRSPESFLIPGLFLSAGASLGFQNGEALSIAVRANSVLTLSSLLQYDIDTEQLSPAFNLLIESDTSRDEKFAMSLLLLQKGIEQSRRDWALKMQFKIPAQLDQRFIELLLRYESAPHCFNGECFSIAASGKNESVFNALAAAPFDIGVVTHSLITMLDTATETIRWLRLCCDRPNKKGHIGSRSLRKAIDKFPVGDQLIDLLLTHGCNTRFQVEVPEGKTSLLFWAIGKRGVSDQIILKLLEHGANGFSSALKHKQTVAHAAAILGRAVVMQELIQCKVNINLQDAKKFTPLYYATFHQDLDTMKVLVQAGAGVDDGSLHIAAEKCFVEGVSLLLQADHDADFPSLLFDGRSPLAQLCLLGKSTGADWVGRLHKTMKMIKKGIPRGNIASRFDDTEKTVLHLALDNEHEASDMVKALLAIYKPYQSMDINEAFLFVGEDGLHYSPTKYVELCCGEMPAAEKAELIKCLKAQRFRDRYFADGLRQPANAVGLPTAISEAIKEEEQAERKRQREKQQKRELAELEAKLQADLHKQAMRDQELEARQKRNLAQREAEAAREEERKSKQQQLDLEVLRINTIKRKEKQALEERHQIKKKQALEMGSIASAQQMIEGRQALELQAAEYQMELMYRKMRRELENGGGSQQPRQLPSGSEARYLEYLPD